MSTTTIIQLIIDSRDTTQCVLIRVSSLRYINVIGRKKFGESKINSSNSPLFSTANISRYTVLVTYNLAPFSIHTVFVRAQECILDI